MPGSSPGMTSVFAGTPPISQRRPCARRNPYARPIVEGCSWTTFAQLCFPSPREAAGRNQGRGVAPRIPLSANALIDPPPPTPQSELRSSRPRHALTRADGGEKKTSSIFKQHIPSLRAKRSNPSSKRKCGLLRRFAPRNDERTYLAMTRGHTFAISRQHMSEFCKILCPSFQRAQGMPGAWCARSRACRVVNTRVSHHGHTGNTRHSPRNGFTTYFVLSPVIGLFCHRRLRSCLRKLDPSVEASGPHDFAVRYRAIRQRRTQRPPHPAPNVRDDREAPLL